MEGKGIKKDTRMAAYWLQKVATSTGTLSSGELDPGNKN
jgi:TPR repeat protein